MQSIRQIGRSFIAMLRRKRALGNLGAILLAIPTGCLALVLLAVMDARGQEEQLQRHINESEARVQTSQLILRYMIDQETGTRGYLLTQDQQFLDPYHTAKRDLPGAIARLQRQSPGQEPAIQNLQQQIDQRFQVTEQLLALGQKLDYSAAISSFTSPQQALSKFDTEKLRQGLRQGRQITDVLRQTIAQFDYQQQMTLQQQQAKLQQRRQVVDRIQLIGALLSVITYAGVVYVFQILDREVFQRDQTIQQTAATIQTLTDNLVDGVIMLDRQGLIENLNPAAETILGYPSPSLWGRALVHVLLPVDESETQAQVNSTAWIEALMKMGGVHQLQAYRRNGDPVPIELSISRSSAKIPTLVVLIRDISERLRLMQTLEEKIEELAQVNQTLSVTNLTLQNTNQSLENFVQAAAHDLKTPLRGIASLAQWIESDIESFLNDETRDYFKLLYQRVLRLQAITNGLLSYVRIDSWISQTQHCDVGLLIQNICQQLLVPEQFTVHFTTDMPVLHTSSLALRLVLEELIRNAIEHHDRNQGIIHIAALPQEQAIEFVVQDDGPGIPLVYRDRVLKMFQVLEHMPDSAENIGVGLALVKKTIDLVGGQLHLESVANSDRGLEVHFTWPT